MLVYPRLVTLASALAKRERPMATDAVVQFFQGVRGVSDRLPWGRYAPLGLWSPNIQQRGQNKGQCPHPCLALLGAGLHLSCSRRFFGCYLISVSARCLQCHWADLTASLQRIPQRVSKLLAHLVGVSWVTLNKTSREPASIETAAVHTLCEGSSTYHSRWW